MNPYCGCGDPECETCGIMLTEIERCRYCKRMLWVENKEPVYDDHVGCEMCYTKDEAYEASVEVGYDL